MNGVLYQSFHWHEDRDDPLWRRLAAQAGDLASAGFTAIWLPPPTKGAAGPDDEGYAVYDLYDLGEFDQRGAVPTRYGTRAELGQACRALHDAGLHVYVDVVLNHRQGADEIETVAVRRVDPEDRTRVDANVQEIRAWTRFTCPGRAGAHSSFEWNASCFSSVDCDADRPDDHALYLLDGRRFSDEVSDELGNFDHLLGCDVDFDSPAVREEVQRWLAWVLQATDADGLRFDALKHLPAGVVRDALAQLRADRAGRELLAIGEYWLADTAALTGWLAATGDCAKLFDVPLHFRLYDAGARGRDYDLRTVFDDTLVAARPDCAVTFVDNHDTQPGQALQSFVADWFKPIAYALILLRRDGYPCVFRGDFEGHVSDHDGMADHGDVLRRLLDARRRFNHGDQHDVFATPTTIGWVRTGDEAHPGAMVVVISTAEEASLPVPVFRGGVEFRELLGRFDHAITVGDDGVADFPAPAGGVAVWVTG